MLTTALLKRAEEPGHKYADIQALAVGRSASTLDQGGSKELYIFSASRAAFVDGLLFAEQGTELMQDFLWHARGCSPIACVSAPWTNPASAILTTALLKRAEEPGFKYADIQALAVDRSACTLDQRDALRLSGVTVSGVLLRGIWCMAFVALSQ